MKSFVKRTMMVVALGLASASFAPASMAEAKSCGSNGQKACPWHHKGPSCKPGLRNKWGKCVPASQTIVGKVGEGLKDIGDGVGDKLQDVGSGIGNVFSGGNKEKVRAAARTQGAQIADIARQISKALPSGRDAKDLAKAIRDKDGNRVQSILKRNTQMRQSFDQLERLGFRTITVGIESSGSYGIGGAHETGFSMDMDFDSAAKVYTTTSLSGGYHFGGGNDLVFSFFKSGNAHIDGHAFGSIAEFDVGSGAGLNMWFSAKPFDFQGFSLGVGIGSIGGGGALTYAYTKLWN
ncbi:hypothetical protein [Primorskyibacter sp. 2E233]|uniref:hypothetical protein n=1 Tax=Primorskyibacter sp. 2E233 TaxID=3413431 RepID=UPI003BF12408